MSKKPVYGMSRCNIVRNQPTLFKLMVYITIIGNDYQGN